VIFFSQQEHGMKRFRVAIFWGFLFMTSVLAGCSGDPGQLDGPVAVTGTLKDASGKPLRDVAVELQPLEVGHLTTIQVGADGSFSGEAIPGKYAYRIVPGAKARTAPKGIPAEFAEQNMERTYEVGSSTPLDIQLP
jgi:hypothetical protein